MTGLQFFKRQVISCNGDVYLRRWIIFRCDRFAVYLHKFERGDEDDCPHDHPWDFTSIVLWGGYTEERWYRDVIEGHMERWPDDLQRGWLSTARRMAEECHRVRNPYGPCWTLVITGPRRRSWGFQTRDGWVHWRTFLGLPAGDGPSNVESNQ